MTRRGLALSAALLAVTGCGTVAPNPGPALSPASTMHEAGLVDLRSLVPDLSQDIKYFGSDNFVGAPVDGYLAPRCWLKREAAEALARVEARLREVLMEASQDPDAGEVLRRFIGTSRFVPVSADDRRALDELARGVLRIRTEVE